MNPKLIAALNRQITHEMQASQGYLAMSYWCEMRHYAGFAKFLRKQSAEEQGHAEKMMKHMASREVAPAVGALAAPPASFKHLTDVAKEAYDLERANTAGIHAAYEAALDEKDYPAQVMLHWFISEQVEEEAWSDTLLVKTREATCAGALSGLDRHLDKILFSDAGAA